MNRTSWVIGASGLLGQHVATAISDSGRQLVLADITWSDRPLARRQLADGITALLASGGEWEIVWCAGAGVVATPEADLAREVEQFTWFLEDLAAHDLTDGAFFLVSSAGGIWAGTGLPDNDERTEPRPLAAYGIAKLQMEDALAAAVADTGLRAWVGRATNLYGPGQRLDKGQGLVSTLCRAVLTGEPMTLRASLETRRDYLHITDCAALVVAGLDRVRAETGSGLVVKILCHGTSSSIQDVIDAVGSAAGEQPPTVLDDDRASAPGQVLESGFTSVVWPELNALASTSLEAGVASTLADLAERTR